MTGIVSDTICGATHMMEDKPAAECLRYCAKQGTKSAPVADKKVYTLEGHEAEFDKYPPAESHGERDVERRTLTVESLIPAK